MNEQIKTHTIEIEYIDKHKTQLYDINEQKNTNLMKNMAIVNADINEIHKKIGAIDTILAYNEGKQKREPKSTKSLKRAEFTFDDSKIKNSLFGDDSGSEIKNKLFGASEDNDNRAKLRLYKQELFKKRAILSELQREEQIARADMDKQVKILNDQYNEKCNKL